MSGSDLLKRYNEHKKKTQSETVSNTTNANASASKSSGSDLLERYKKYKEQSIGAPVAEYEDPLTEEKIAERRALYQSNADRIADLETTYKDASKISQAIYDRSNALLYGAQRGGNIRATMDEATANDATIAELKKQLETYGDVDALKKEMEELKSANLRYQREQKVLDDYFVPRTEEFLQNAAYRDYGNPTIDELEEFDTFNQPNINDKYAFYMKYRNGTESYDLPTEAINMMVRQMSEGKQGSWEYLKDNEIDIYYNLLKTEGQESAYEFLDAMQTILNKRATQAMAQQVADAGVGAQIAYNVASIPANVLGGAGSFVDDAIHMIKGEDINPYSYAHRWQNFAQAVRQDTASDINEATGGAALPFVGTTFGDVYQAIMSGVDSAVGIGLGGTTYGILMGMGAASSEAKELYEKGASMGQIAAGGILAGAAEMVFEKYSIDKFVKMGDTKTVATIFVNALKQGGVEASEEVLTEIANTLSDAVVMGSQSDWQGYIDKYIAEGYSESEATVKALFNDVAPNVINAGIGGLISGGAMGSLGSTGSYFNYQNRLKSHGQSIIDRGGVDTVKALADDMAGVKAVSKASSKVGSKASAKNVGGLSVAIEEAMSAQNKADIESALVEKGLSKSEAKRITEYLTGTAELTAEQKAEINNNKQVAEVVAEFVKNSDSTLNQRKLNLMAARLGVNLKGLTNSKTTTASGTEIKKELNFKEKVSAKKQTTNEATGEAIAIDKSNAIARVENGEVYFNTDKGVVPLTDIAYASEDEAMLYDGLSDLNPAIANALISNYDGKISARAYVNGVREGVLLYGKNNFQGIGKDIPGDTYFSDLSETDQNLALKLGREYAKIEATKAEGNLKTAIKNAAERAEADKSSGKQIAEGKIRFESNVDGGKLNRTQRRTVSLAKHLAKAIGIDIVFYDATKAGTKHSDSNGYFDPKDNSIHLDLQNAATDSKTIAFTLSHELVHFIKKWSPAKFKAFADFLMEQYAVHGVSTSTLLANKMAALNTTDADYAYEEMIADACERMLLDSNAVVKLMELRKSDLELFEKVKLHILQLLNKIRNAFKGVDPNTEEGIALQKMEDVLGKLHEMFEDAALDAAKTYGEASKYGAREVYREARGLEIGSRSLEELSEAQNTEGEPLFQYKAIQADEKAYRTMLTKWGKMTDVQIDNLFATIDTAIELIKDNLEALDYAWEADIDDRAFSPVKANSDKLYKVSLDFSTLCRKRLLQQTVQVQLQEALNQPLTKEEGIAIRDALIAIQEEGRQIEVACALCYVESARMKSPEQIKKFMNNKEQVIKEFFAGKSGGTMKEKIAKAEADARETLAKENPNGIKGKDGKTMVDPLTAKLKELPKKYADVIRDAKREAKASYNPTPEEQKLIDVAMDMTVSDFTSPKGLENLAKNYPALFDAYTSYVRNATKSKGIEGDVWWRAGDSKKIGDVLIATMNKENGLRSQSWSDFQVVHILDYIAATIELATREAKEQAYTKVPDFAELMGKTGVMINLSLIPTAKFSGKLEYDGVEGMAYKRALELRDKYPDTVGTICIGISNEQIKMLLADMTIDYVIPYHKSGMSAVIRKAMHIPTWDQYEDYQGEKELSRTEAQKRADKYGVKLLSEKDLNYQKGTSFSEWFDLKEAQQIAKMENANPSDKAKQKEYGIMYGGYMAMQNAAQNYLKLCAERGLAPKFSHEKADFTAEDNYWKLLIDRKMVNNVTGAVIEQQTIKPIFDESEIMRILNDELERYPKVKEDQEYAIRRVTEAYLSGNLKGGMSAKAIAEVMKKPVDNVTNVNILASAEEIDDGIKKQAKQTSRITLGMSDTERSEILNGKSIVSPVYDGQSDELIAEKKAKLESRKRDFAKSAIFEIAEKLEIVGKEINFNDVEVKIILSKSNLSESMSKEATPEQIAKLLPVLSPTAENSVVIERHDNRYYYDTDTVYFDNLLGAYIDGDSLVPVRFGLKHSRTGTTTLYVVVDQNKVALEKLGETKKDRGLQDASPTKAESSNLRRSVTYSISQIVPFVNSKDLLRYLPDDMLDGEQKRVKWEAIAATIKRTNDKNDYKYKKYIESGNLIAANQMVVAAAKANGYTVEGWHGSRYEFNIFSKEKRGSNTHTQISNHWFFAADKETANSYYPYGVMTELQKQHPEWKWANPETLKEKGKLYHLYLKMENPLIVDVADYDYDSHRENADAWMEYIQQAEENGNDGIILLNALDNQLKTSARDSTVYMFKESAQAKSADTITRDDNDNIIPISERFNSENDDIRYQKKPVPIQELLANALESEAKEGDERNALRNYQTILRLEEKENESLRSLDERHNRKQWESPIWRIWDTDDDKLYSFEQLNDMARELIDDFTKKVRHYTVSDSYENHLYFVTGYDVRLKYIISASEDSDSYGAYLKSRKEIENRIKKYQNELHTLYQSEHIHNVLKREQAKYQNQVAEKGKEAFKKYREKVAEQNVIDMREKYREWRSKASVSRSKTKLKGDTRKLVASLTSLLENGNKKRNIKTEEHKVVTAALELAKVLLSNDLTNEDIVRLGVKNATKEELALLDEYKAHIVNLDAVNGQIAGMQTDEKLSKEGYALMDELEATKKDIKEEMSTLSRKLSDLFARERFRLNETKIEEFINALFTEYSVLAKSDKAYIKNAYREEVKDRLANLKTSLGDKIARDMDIYQLTELYDTLKMIEKMVRVSNKLFIDGKLEDLKSKVSAVEDEVMSATDTPKEYGTVVSTLESAFREFSWNNLRPIDAFERLGSPTLEKLFWDFVDGMTKAGQIIRETGEAIYEARTKYGYSKWKLNEVSKTFTTRDGLVFKPTLADKLSIYAYSQREQAEKHMLDGGFVFDTGATYKEVENGKTYVRKKLSQTYRMDDITIGSIIASLTQEQRDYVDAILPIFTALGEMGNEVSDVMYGIDLFKEKVYFPLKTSADYRSSTSETLNSTPTMSSMTNSGFTKQTVPNADNAIVLRAFDDVTVEHIEKMANWVSLVLPIENLRKVFENVSREEDRNSKSIKSLIGERYGVEAQKYFEQWITDINGGVVPQGAKSFLGKMFSRAKAMSVSANLSVVAQQYSSIFRAMELVDPKYFTPFINKEARVSDEKAYDELIKYAPITIIKEMGGFDVGSGHNAKSYIGDKGARMDAKHIGRKIGDVSMWGASLMDKLGWVTIWKAIKAEVAKEQKLKVGTDEFFEACKKRFTEVIVKTQVFDSVASRSGYMRSQNDLVKFSTSFLGEPTAIMGRMFVSTHNLVRAIKSGDKAEIKSAAAHFGRTMGVIAVSGTLANLAKALIYAGRDDDEDKAFIKKWSSNFAEALESDLNPLNSLPFARDIMSAIEGWDVERPDMTLIAELVTSIKRMLDGEPTLDDSLNLTGSVGNFFGIPLKNVIREIESVITVVDDIFDDVKPTDVSGAFIEGITGKKRSTTELLYRAMVNKDKGKVNAIRSGYKTESAYLTALRTALRENDPRIAEAVVAWYSGDVNKRVALVTEIEGEKNFTPEIVRGTINAEINGVKTKTDDAIEYKKKGEVKKHDKIVAELLERYPKSMIEKLLKESLADFEDKNPSVKKEESIYFKDDINTALEGGDITLAKSIISELIDTKVANGMEEKNAKSSVKSSMTSYWKPLVIEAYKSKNASEKIRIRDLLYETGLYGKSRKEVKEAMDKWYDDYLKE